MMPNDPSRPGITRLIEMLRTYAEIKVELVVPCEDCGSADWDDWTLLPHEVFNSICPGGNRDLCLTCFAVRILEKQYGK